MRSKIGDVVVVTIGQGPDRKDIGQFKIIACVQQASGHYKTLAEWVYPGERDPIAFDVTFAYDSIGVKNQSSDESEDQLK